MPSTAATDTPSVAFLSDYLPRRCGIATFTYDLCESVAHQAAGKHDVFTVAVNDVPEGYPYPDRVRFEIRHNVTADYRLAAEFLNINQVSVVCLQHEYGIYGGPSGSHLLGLLRRLRRPLVTTLHTILRNPSDEQRAVLKEVIRLSTRLVVMSETAMDILTDVYDFPGDKAVLIPHGIPDVPFVDPNFYKDQFNVEGKRVLLTFGLLSPGKGIETAIDALPRVVAKHPEVVYVVLGETHPHIKRETGEEYRNSLFRRVTDLGMDEHVLFVNRFVDISELCEYLGTADIYVTPYLNEDQIVSGTLAYALGTGKATVSTPYWYAREMLRDGRGRIVPFRDPTALADQVIDLLDNEIELNATRKRAYTFCRKMVWKRVAQDYLDLFAEAREAWVENRLIVPAARVERQEKPHELPEVDLRHLRTLTDDTGVLRGCLFSTPDRSQGYCTDDNARALLVTSLLWEQNQDESVLPLMQTYLAFLAHAMDDETGRFHAFLNYDRTWSEVIGSEESHARALWALGVATALCPHESQIALATRLFKRALSVADDFTSARAWALTVVGIHGYLRRFGGDSEVRRSRADLTSRLAKAFTDHASDDWFWCEDVVTYVNGKLPHALLMSGKWMNKGEWIDLGKRALRWLLQHQTSETGMLSLVGTDGWYRRGGERARFDQLPIEAHALVDACVEAYHVTREREWVDHARRAFHWFLGDNDLRTPLYDFTTGGCRDGLHADRVNENQSAESTLAWLMSLLLMQDLEMEQNLGTLPADKTLERRAAAKQAIKPTGPVVGKTDRKDRRPDALTDSHG